MSRCLVPGHDLSGLKTRLFISSQAENTIEAVGPQINGPSPLEQAGVLERLYVRQLAQRPEPEHGQKGRGGHIGERGSNLRQARPCSHQIEAGTARPPSPLQELAAAAQGYGATADSANTRRA